MSLIEKAVDRLGNPASQTAERRIPRQSPRVVTEAEAAHADLPGRGGPHEYGGEGIGAKLDFERLSRDGYLTPTSALDELVEQYRALKRPLLKKLLLSESAGKEAVNPVVVTSALAGEGKTFTAFNLAMSVAMERDLSVLLIDADLSQRSLSALLGLSGARGLSDVLAGGRANWTDAIVTTNVPKLSVMPAGGSHRFATELLTSGQMRRFIREVADRYLDRLVLVDAAPVLRTTQAAALCDLAAQIVFVVEEGKTSVQAIQEAIGLMGEDKAIGLVLNKSRRAWGGNYSPYYGGY